VYETSLFGELNWKSLCLYIYNDTTCNMHDWSMNNVLW